MDLISIGKFLKEQRKAKKLTQAGLANKLEVSEKTVSKWECGNGFPDVTLVLPLCKVLEISANELFSGQKIEDKEYKTKAEQNLITKELEKQHLSKLLLSLEIVLAVVAVLFLLSMVVVSAYLISQIWLKIVLIVFGFLIMILSSHFCIIIEKDAGYYECGHCKHKYIPKMKDMYFSLHINRTRFMKCPNCKKSSWQKKVIK